MLLEVLVKMTFSRIIRLVGESNGNKGIWCATFATLYEYFSFSPHPYIFINNDRNSITFVGFKFNANGDLINPVDDKVIEKAILSQHLMAGLKRNKVNFNEDYRTWNQ